MHKNIIQQSLVRVSTSIFKLSNSIQIFYLFANQSDFVDMFTITSTFRSGSTSITINLTSDQPNAQITTSQVTTTTSQPSTSRTTPAASQPVTAAEVANVRGLTRSQIDAIPRYRIHRENECSICLDNYERENFGRKLNCKVSIFHQYYK